MSRYFRTTGVFVTLVMALVSTPQAETLDETREAVRQADIALNRSVAQRDTELFASLIAPEAVFLGGGLSEGREAIIESWSEFFAADRTVTLSWTPHTVEIAESGDLAYTLGGFELHTLTDGDIVTTSIGTYLTVWKRQENGSWQAVADAGTPPQPVTDTDAD